MTQYPVGSRSYDIGPPTSTATAADVHSFESVRETADGSSGTATPRNEANRVSFSVSSEANPPTPKSLHTPVSTASDRDSIEFLTLSPITGPSLDQVPLGPLARCLVDIVTMLSSLSELNTSNGALYEDMMKLGTDINLLFKSFSTHFHVHPSAAPVDGSVHSGYYIKLFVGRYVQQLLQSAARRSDAPQLLYYRPKHLDHLVAELDHEKPSLSADACSIPVKDLTEWQDMLPWWSLLLHGPSKDQCHKFFRTLRLAGILHTPQPCSHCTCNEDFSKLYQDAIRICLKLRFVRREFSFSSTPMIVSAFDINTMEESTEATDCVLPSLKIRRGDAGWTTIFQGYGVVPRETVASMESSPWRLL